MTHQFKRQLGSCLLGGFFALALTAGESETAKYMKDLSEKGAYTVSAEVKAKIDENFCGYYTDEATTASIINKYFKEYNYLCDTHTAVAVHAAKEYATEYKPVDKMLVVSTASPYKFAADVLLSISGERPEDDLMALEALEKCTGISIPSPLAAILSKTAIHKTVIDREEMKSAVAEFALN